MRIRVNPTSCRCNSEQHAKNLDTSTPSYLLCERYTDIFSLMLGEVSCPCNKYSIFQSTHTISKHKTNSNFRKCFNVIHFCLPLSISMNNLQFQSFCPHSWENLKMKLHPKNNLNSQYSPCHDVNIQQDLSNEVKRNNLTQWQNVLNFNLLFRKSFGVPPVGASNTTVDTTSLRTTAILHWSEPGTGYITGKSEQYIEHNEWHIYL